MGYHLAIDHKCRKAASEQDCKSNNAFGGEEGPLVERLVGCLIEIYFDNANDRTIL